MNPNFPIVLAVDLHSIMWVAVLIISGISWVLKWVNEGVNQSKPKRKERTEKTGGSALERFLEELEQQKSGQKQEQRRPQQQSSQQQSARQSPSRQSSQRQPTSQRQGGKQQTRGNARETQPEKSARQEPAKRQSTVRPTSDSIASPGLYEGVRSHVAAHLETRNVDKQVERDIDQRIRSDIDARVTVDVGSNAAAVPLTTMAPVVAPVHPIVAVLRNPQGMRQALIMSEVLNRPKSLRNSSNQSK